MTAHLAERRFVLSEGDVTIVPAPSSTKSAEADFGAAMDRGAAVEQVGGVDTRPPDTQLGDREAAHDLAATWIDPAALPAFLTDPNTGARAKARAARKLRLAQYRKYSEDQPRDDHGRFGEGGATLEAASQPQYAGLSEADKGAINAYAGHNESFAINSELRVGATGPNAPTIAALTDVLGKASLPHDMQVYRGVSMWPGFEAEMVPGAVVADKGFLSTTTDKFEAMARGLNQARDTGTEMAIIRISAAAGSHGLYLEPLLTTHTPGGGEQEILFQRGSSIRITSVGKESLTPNGTSRTVIDAELE